MVDASLPLRPGDAGAAVRDLHERLQRVGYTPDGADEYGPTTEAAIRAFQADRGLRTDGICGAVTWTTLVEAGWRLGDRLLYERSRMLRGDDVADLQARLGGLGFLDDRIDGILGPNTRRALEDFQRNCGLTVDGICGPESLAELARLAPRTPTAVKAGVVERARLRDTPRQLAGRKILVGDLGGVAALASSIERALAAEGAEVAVTSNPDGSAQAQEANAVDADLYLGLTIGPAVRCAYYEAGAFRSEGGHLLAARLAELLGAPAGLGHPVEISGMRLPVLRETRMTAVVCELGPARVVVEHTWGLTDLVRAAVGVWVADPLATL